jgi:hypothetical protein
MSGLKKVAPARRRALDHPFLPSLLCSASTAYLSRQHQIRGVQEEVLDHFPRSGTAIAIAGDGGGLLSPPRPLWRVTGRFLVNNNGVLY